MARSQNAFNSMVNQVKQTLIQQTDYDLKIEQQKKDNAFIFEVVDKYMANHQKESYNLENNKFYYVNENSQRLEFKSFDSMFFDGILWNLDSEYTNFKRGGETEFYLSKEEMTRIHNIKDRQYNYNANTDPTIKDINKDIKKEYKEPSKTSTAGSPDFDDRRKDQDINNEVSNQLVVDKSISSLERARMTNKYQQRGVLYNARQRVVNSKIGQRVVNSKIYKGIAKTGSTFVDATPLTKDTRKFYFYEKFGITDSSSENEKKACMEAIERSKLVPSIKQETMKGKSMPQKIAYGIMGGIKWLGNTINQKIFYAGKKIESVATGKSFKLKEARKFYEDRLKFVNEEKAAAIDYKSLTAMGMNKEADALLNTRAKERQKLTESQIKDALDPSFADPSVEATMKIFNQEKNLQNFVSKSFIQEQYNNPEFTKNLNNLGVQMTKDYKLEKTFIDESTYVRSDAEDISNINTVNIHLDSEKESINQNFIRTFVEPTNKDLNDQKVSTIESSKPILNEALINNPDKNEIDADNYELS